MRGILLILTLMAVSSASAQKTGEIPSVFKDVGVDEKLGETVPLDIQFRDEQGNEVELGTYFESGRPVLLNMVYHDCPMLCSLMLTEFTKTLSALRAEEDWLPGDEFDVVTVSFSATEMPDLAARAKERYVGQLGSPEAGEGWHFLTGSEQSIHTLAEAVGFRFKWIPSSKEFAHPAVLMFLSPDGVITRYIHDMAYETRDVRLALVEASEGTVGSTVDRIMMYCYRYDATANSYVLHAWTLMRLAGGLTIAILGLFLFIYWRRERRSLAPTLH